MRARWWGVVCACVMVVPSSRLAAQVEVSGTTLLVGVGEAQRAVELGCTGTQVHLAGDRAFVACGEAGVALVDLGSSPVRVLLLPQQAAVQGVFAAEGSLWARLADGSARPVATLPAAPSESVPPPTEVPSSSPGQLGTPTQLGAPAQRAAPLAPASPPPGYAPPSPWQDPRWRPGPAPFEPVDGRVVEVQRDRAHVLFEGWVERGTVVELLRQRPSRWADRAEEEMVVGRGFVETSGTGRLSVQLETNTAADLQMHVRTTSRRSGSWMMPPLALGVAQIAANYRMYLPIDTLAVGILGDLTMGYLINLDGEVGIRVAANLTNMGGVVGVDPTPFAAVGHGYLSFAMRYFEVGVGFGASSLNTGGWPAPPPGRVGFSFAQLLRIGSEDGLSLRLASSVVVASERWEFGDFYGDGRIPLGHGVWLLVRGGGGNTGLFYGDVGARVRLTGNGLADTLFLSAAIGFGHVSIGNFSGAGPLFSLGLEYRL